jgi:small subunit ribosomal protein S17
MEIKNIGIKVRESKGEAKPDKKSPFTGQIKLRGRAFTGTVISDSMQKTVTVQWQRLKFLKKFERYEKRRSKVKAHNPENINAKKGDVVRIVECRPLSKTKNFVVVEILGKEKGFAQKMEALSESKVTKEKRVEDEE